MPGGIGIGSPAGTVAFTESDILCQLRLGIFDVEVKDKTIYKTAI